MFALKEKSCIPCLIIGTFILFPFLMLPFIFMEIYNGRRYPLVLLAIFMGCLSMFYYPSGDQFRYFNDLNAYRFLSFNDVFHIDSPLFVVEFNLINILLFALAKININLELFRWLMVFIVYIITFWIFIDICNRHQLSRNTRFIVFLLLYLATPLYLTTYGFRTGVGACFMTLGVYLLCVKSSKIGYFYLLMASITHVFFLLHSIFIPILMWTRYYMSRRLFLLVMLVVSVSTIFIIDFLYGRWLFLDLLFDSYVYGEFGRDYVWDSFMIRDVVLNGGIPFIFSGILFLLTKPRNKMANIIYCILLIFIISLPYYTFIHRVIRSSLLLVVVYLCLHIEQKFVMKYYNILAIWLFISFLVPFWNNRYQYKHAQLEKVAYYPLPMLLLNTYEKDDINKKVDYDGEFRK